jgi:tRNA pseudouridine(38-40) synthase
LPCAFYSCCAWRFQVKTLAHASVSIADSAVESGHFLGRSSAKLVTIRIVAKSFLHNMVRRIVGTLVAVGADKLRPSDLVDIFEHRRRCAAPPLAPPQGLYLVNVTYDDIHRVSPR